MSKTTLAETNGWTPVIDSLVQEFGLTTAAVFGRIWRYCQGERGVCNATIETISHELGIGYNTAVRHIKKLLKAGYIEDRTPGLRHHPHIYTDTGKAKSLLEKNRGKPKWENQSTKMEDSGHPKRMIKREDNRHNKKESGNQSSHEFPPSLNTPNFIEVWQEFLCYRKEIKKPVSQISSNRLLKKLSEYPDAVAMQMLNQSIENGWVGVFPVKNFAKRPKQNMNSKYQLSPDKVLELLKESK